MGLTSRLRQRASTASFRPELEALEDRWLPSTLTVTNAGGYGAGSLRAVIDTAQSGDTIVFAGGLSGQTIKLWTGSPYGRGEELVIDKDLTIQGPGAGKLTIDAGYQSNSRLFEVTAGVQVSLSGLTLTGGNGRHGGLGDVWNNEGEGGAILNLGTLTVTNCVVSSSSAAWFGGGIANFGSMTLSGTTVKGNSMSSTGGALVGGGIYNSGTLTLSGSTVSQNSSAGSGGGIYNSGTLTLSGSTVSQNTAANGAGHGTGGGIYNAASGWLTLIASTVTGNKAEVGADIYNLGQLTRDKSSKIGKIAP